MALLSALHHEHEHLNATHPTLTVTEQAALDEAVAAETAIAGAAAEQLDKLVPPPARLEVSRRTIVIGSVATAASLALNKLGLKRIAETVGWLFDRAISPEKILPGQATILEPRYDNRLVAEAKAHNGSAEIHTLFGRTPQGRQTLRLGFDTPLAAEHTNERITDATLHEAGTAIITTASGEQEYVTLFQSGSELYGIGFEGGVFKYSTKLGRPGQESTGEFERVMVSGEAQGLPARALAKSAWSSIEAANPKEMTVQKVRRGTETLQAVGYRPYATIHASTKMPKMANIAVGPGALAQTAEEAIETGKRFFALDGSLQDANHFGAKTEEYFNLYTKLKALSAFTAPNSMKPIEISIPYSKGSSGMYTFLVSPQSLRPETLPRLAFELMGAASEAMEGVSQNWAYENLPKKVAPKLPEFGAYGPEDLFSNTQATIEAAMELKNSGIDDALTETFRLLREKHSDLKQNELFDVVESLVKELRPQFVAKTLRQYVTKRGVQRQYVNETISLPYGIYHRIPVKKDGDSTAPPASRLPNFLAPSQLIRYELTHIPVGEIVAGKALAKFSS